MDDRLGPPNVSFSLPFIAVYLPFFCVHPDNESPVNFLCVDSMPLPFICVHLWITVVGEFEMASVMAVDPFLRRC